MFGKALAFAETDMHWAVGQKGQGFETFLQQVFLSLHDEVIVGSQGCAAEGTDKDGLGSIIRAGHNAKRSLA